MEFIILNCSISTLAKKIQLQLSCPQAAAIRFEFRGGEWKEGFLQIDGEPWKQPISKNSTTVVEIKRVPLQSTVIDGE